MNKDTEDAHLVWSSYDKKEDQNPITPYMQAYKLLVEQHERQMRTLDLIFKIVFCFAAILLTFTCYMLFR